MSVTLVSVVFTVKSLPGLDVSRLRLTAHDQMRLSVAVHNSYVIFLVYYADDEDFKICIQ